METNTNKPNTGAPSRPQGRGGFGGARGGGFGSPRPGGGAGGARGGFGGPRRGGSRPPRAERPKPEFDSKMIDIRRVARVMAGGRRFNFSVTLVAGDRKGRVGVGLGKAGDTTMAIDKAMNNAKKNMIKVPMTKEGSIAHEVFAKYGSSKIMIKPAPGRGLVSGSAVRNVLDFAGVRNVSSKIVSRSKNKLNIARAAIAALRQL
ncbi:MAG: 30S ribosomal protein S5 [Candidatus Vogelbacteria bacterium]|nr:30S ribosomal protein S5 [Candidatus Vogelbacteria bacterium]